jgi:hypothetical protein
MSGHVDSERLRGEQAIVRRCTVGSDESRRRHFDAWVAKFRHLALDERGRERAPAHVAVTENEHGSWPAGTRQLSLRRTPPTLVQSAVRPMPDFQGKCSDHVSHPHG